jgi:N6-adenosine-specific RNA methylase IME4
MGYLELLTLTEGQKYQIIYADPPWTYPNWNLRQKLQGDFLGISSQKDRSPSRHYPTMTIDDIRNLPISQLTDTHCVLFLWVLPNMLKEGIATLESWGFTYKTIAFTWVKKNKKKDSWFWGMGGWTRSNAELCLLGIKGQPKRIAKNIHSIIETPIDTHSKKPSEVRDKIVLLCGDVPRIELFARTQALGWDAWGNETDKFSEGHPRGFF